MVQIIPFRGLRYNTQTVSLSDVTAPPYDVIDEALQQRLYEQSPYNCVRLILGQKTPDDTASNSVYTRAAGYFSQWQQQNLLSADPKPCMYAYTQTFNNVTRKGLVALLRIEAYDTRQVLPHEKTIAKYIADRRELGKTCLANLSQIFMLYSDPTFLAESLLFDETLSTPWNQAIDGDGVVHQLKPVPDDAAIAKIQALFARKNLLIADGHHRYQTALTIKQEARDAYKAQHGYEPADGQLLTDYWMVFLANMDDPGLLVYPTHRLLKEWPAGWNQPQFEAALKAQFTVVDNTVFDDDPQSFQARFPDGTVLTLQPKPDNSFTQAVHPELRKLDVTHIDKVIIEGLFGQTAQQMKQDKTLFFERNDDEARQWINEGTMVCGLWTHAPSVHQVKAICEAGELMPQKSTYFYPKILTGLVFYNYAAFPNNNGHALTGCVENATPLASGFFNPQPVATP